MTDYSATTRRRDKKKIKRKYYLTEEPAFLRLTISLNLNENQNGLPDEYENSVI